MNILIPDAAEFAALRIEAKQLLNPGQHFGIQSGIDSLRIHLAKRHDDTADSYELARCRGAAGFEYTVNANTVAGAAAGFHHLLRLLGFGFSFFADAIPSRPMPVRWPFAADHVEIRPDFDVRGLLPWHNFLNSPTVWNPEDYKRYLLTLWRWGGNTVLFHNYDEEPLAAFRDPANKMWRSGQGFQTTLDAPWGGVKGIKLGDFAHGSGNWFPFNKNGAWGARNAFADDPIAAAQEEFAHACTFASGLGLKIAFGFELIGDPSWPGFRDFLASRLRHVLETYPAIGTLCLWQQEGLGVVGWQNGNYATDIASLEQKYGIAFDYLKTSSPARYREGVRLVAMFRLACELATEIRPDIRIAFAGWGGDRWMRWGDYWRGLHRLLPADVILAQLDNIMPHCEDTTSRVTAEIAGERELWSIPWIESDGGGGAHASQWHPQDAVEQQARLARSAKATGYRGLLGIHWQTAGCELNAMHLVQATGWSASDSVPEFYADYATTFFTSGVNSGEVTAILRELEALGTSWTGAGQQTECATFEWDSMPRLSSKKDLPDGMAALEQPLWTAREAMFQTSELDVRTVVHFDNLLFRFATQKLPSDACQRLEALRQRFMECHLHSPHARRLQATMDFVLAFEAIKRKLEPRGELTRRQSMLLQMRALGLSPDTNRLAEYRRKLLEVEALWPILFAAQRARLDTVGDYGNLANINLKAWQAWRRFRDTPVDASFGTAGVSAVHATGTTEGQTEDKP